MVEDDFKGIDDGWVIIERLGHWCSGGYPEDSVFLVVSQLKIGTLGECEGENEKESENGCGKGHCGVGFMSRNGGWEA